MNSLNGMNFWIQTKFLFSVFLLVNFNLYAQDESFTWVKQLTGENDVIAKVVKTDIAGNVFVYGLFEDSVDFDPGISEYFMDADTFADGFLAKYTSNGGFLWAKQFVTGVHPCTAPWWANCYTTPSWGFHPTDMVIDNGQNIIIVGSFYEGTDFDPGPGTELFLTEFGDNNGFVCKLTNSGSFVWANQLINAAPVIITGVDVDQNSNIYTTGNFIGGVDFDADTTDLVSTFLHSGGYSNAVFVRKQSPNGEIEWAKQLGGITMYFESDCYPTSIHVDNEGNVLTTGTFTGILDMSPDLANFDTVSSNGWGDIFISKLDTIGEFVWGKTVGGSYWEKASDIVTDSMRNVFIGGSFGYEADFDPGPSTTNLDAVGTSDLYILKLNEFGLFEWVNQIGGPAGGHITAIDIDFQDNIYATGHFGNTVDFDPGPAVLSLSSYLKDAFIAKYNDDGDLKWAHPLGAVENSNVQGNSIHINSNLDVYSTGVFENVGYFGMGTPNQTLFSLSDQDSYIHKVTQPVEIEPEEPIDTIGIDEFQVKHKFIIVKNPAQSVLNLQIGAQSEGVIQMENILGKSLLQFDLAYKGKNFSIDVSHFNKGLYMVSWYKKGVLVQNEKFILK